MLDKYDIENIKKLEDQRFYSKSQGCFVNVEEGKFILPSRVISLEEIRILDEETQEIVSDLLRETETKQRLDKQKDHAFGKDVFLIGLNKEGKGVWLSAPKWDCSWYWGFGYLSTYQGNVAPSRAKDISQHFHFDGLVGAQEYYDSEKGCFRKGEHVSNVYDSKELIMTTFSSDEGWKLSELFKQFHLLKEMAEFSHRDLPGCHLTSSPVEHGNLKAWNKKINNVMIPMITAEIMRILSPEEKDVENETI